jgi:hypothetical protein
MGHSTQSSESTRKHHPVEPGKGVDDARVGPFYRYRHPPDDFGHARNHLLSLIRSFWYVEALACAGRLDAQPEFAPGRPSYANDLGLLS